MCCPSGRCASFKYVSPKRVLVYVRHTIAWGEPPPVVYAERDECFVVWVCPLPDWAEALVPEYNHFELPCGADVCAWGGEQDAERVVSEKNSRVFWLFWLWPLSCLSNVLSAGATYTLAQRGSEQPTRQRQELPTGCFYRAVYSLRPVNIWTFLLFSVCLFFTLP